MKNQSHLRIHGIKNANGEVTNIVNVPSPLAFPKMYCALADEHTYDDGKSSWSFTSSNGFYADVDLSNEQ